MLSSLRRRLLPGLAKGGADHGALALAALLALPPLVSFGATPVPSFEAEWLAGALGLAAACCFGVLGRGGSLAVPVSALLPVGLAALVALQMRAGLVANRGSAWLFLAFLAWSLTLLCTGAAMRTSDRLEKTLALAAYATLASALLNALIAAVQFFGSDQAALALLLRGGGSARPGGNLGQANHLATQMAMGAVSLAWLRASGRLALPWFLGCTLVLASGLAWPGSRSAYALCGGLLVSIWWLTRGLAANERRAWRQAILFLSAAFVAADFAIGALRHASSYTRFSTIQATGEPRMVIWPAALEMFSGAPWWGQGQGRFAGLFFQIGPGLSPSGQTTLGLTSHAHNLVLQLAAEFGLAGVAILLLSAGLWWWRVRQAPVSSNTLWAMGLVVVIGVHSLFEYPLWYAFFLGPFAFAAGLAEGPAAARAGVRALRLLWLGLAGIGGALLGILGNDYRFLPEIGYPVGLAQLERMHDRSLLAPYAGAILHYGLYLDADRIEDKLAFSAEMMRTLPGGGIAYRHAILLGIAGRRAEAATAWRLAVGNYPQLAPLWARKARESGIDVP